jgi:Ala-tRNA(Pro) deacylase
VVTIPEGYLRAVLPASTRIDLRKLREVRGGSKKKIHLASEEDLARDYAEFDLGAVPPIGGGRRDPVVIDSRLAERASVILEAGSHEESVRLRPLISCASPKLKSPTSAWARRSRHLVALSVA